MHAGPRSWLFVPADNGPRIGKAVAGAADAIVVDLEDAVEAAQRPVARVELAAALSRIAGQDPRSVWVRVNSEADELRRDLEVVTNPLVVGLILPKVQRESDVAASRDLIDESGGASLRLVAMIETARAVLRLPKIADTSLLDFLMMGEQDLGAELGLAMGAHDRAFGSVRSSAVVACAAAGLPGPIASPSMAVRDLGGLRKAASTFASTGFSGMVAIHPDQIAPINTAFTPTEEEIARATEVIAAFDAHKSGGVGVYADLDGNMVDEAVVRRARQVLSRSTIVGD